MWAFHLLCEEKTMVNATGASNPIVVALQSNESASKQEPRTDQTQPKQAPAADTQHHDQSRKASSSDETRGQNVDVVA